MKKSKIGKTTCLGEVIKALTLKGFYVFSVQYTQHSAVTGNFSILHLPFYPEPFGFVLND